MTMFNDISSKDSDVKHPPPYTPSPALKPPASGFRIPLRASSSFPLVHQTKRPPCLDADNYSPVFLGSAILPNLSSVHPCKVCPCLSPPCRVPYGGTEVEHQGRYDLLPYDEILMEWVPTSLGRIPHGRRPVEGGYEENGAKLYHALAWVQGVRTPGKTGEHLDGCNIAFGGDEHVISKGYDILCWK
ncbi:hypothetical protein SERLA73DRAFT_90421 [Serpula lacrymans var. lacrymans S7.3]|uniref:Uncharacterized protein n=2 Tax=Serpula lacrymans var. lacrymans TaxID=341189 RepID=F8PZ57_SERL3|nr:uncharacterized protein SERLADRAFT_468496 [Serpula lacrymans var. lacrymans S7.9]EGN99170.1 hypothetical protein SERLA73DRAFT_90421 [Serpula lacrymans var. lacrymans S7.3]EGO24738.1 hypothetical protein SERLADRAFT_468496 [Serpula lacrymans var. lacrymans S7.9]